jgi:hypothetical protein
MKNQESSLLDSSATSLPDTPVAEEEFEASLHAPDNDEDEVMAWAVEHWHGESEAEFQASIAVFNDSY